MKQEKIKKGIGGWLLLFVITVFLGFILLIIGSILDINLLIEKLRYDSIKNIVELVVHIIYFGLSIYFAIYTFYSLVKKHSNAVSLVRMYLIIVTLITLFEPLYHRKPNAIYYCIIFLLYFSYSNRVNNTFPKSKRITKNKDKILFALLVGIFLVYSYINIYIPYTRTAL